MTARPSTLLPGRVSMMSMSSSSNADKPNGTKEASSEKEPAPAEKSKEDVLAEKDRQIASLQVLIIYICREESDRTRCLNCVKLTLKLFEYTGPLPSGPG